MSHRPTSNTTVSPTTSNYPAAYAPAIQLDTHTSNQRFIGLFKANILVSMLLAVPLDAVVTSVCQLRSYQYCLEILNNLCS